MQSQNLPRRDWIKRSLLSFGAAAVAPQMLWASAVENAQKAGQKFIYSDSGFNEYTPPEFPDLDTLKARLVWNENPHGPSLRAAEAFQKAVWDGNHYSWKTLNTLVDKIATYENLSSENIMMGPGSSDLLEKTAIVFFQEGGNVVSADPSYMSLVMVAQAAGGKWKSAKLTADYQHDLDAMEALIDEDTKLVYITNPNNPTATVTDTEKLKAFCRKVSSKVPIFLDEAYLELSDGGLKNSMAPLIAEGHNVLVSRTFSKVHGMAGLRLGYMLALPETLKLINDITRGGMGITGPTIAAGSASMDDKDYQISVTQKLVDARNYMTAYLDKRDMDYMPSQTNFVMFPLESMTGDEFLTQIYERKIAVRAFKFWDKEWCRVSMGTMEEMKIFTDALDEIIA